MLRIISTLSVIALAACEAEKPLDEDTGDAHYHGGEHSDDSLDCDDVTTTLALDAASALGFSGQEALDVAAAASERSGEWVSGGAGSPLVTLTVEVAGDPIFHDLERAEGSGGGMEPADDLDYYGDACPDYLEIPVTITFSTDDGAFAEVVSGQLIAPSLDAVGASADLDWENLGGSYVIEEFDTGEWEDIRLSLRNTWRDGSIEGEISLSASSTMDDGDPGDPDVGVAMMGSVLVWPPSGEDGGDDTGEVGHEEEEEG